MFPADAPAEVQSCWPFTPPRSLSPAAETLTTPQVSLMRTYFPFSVVANVPVELKGSERRCV